MKTSISKYFGFSQNAQIQPSSSNNTTKIKILIIDDNAATVNFFVKELIEKHSFSGFSLNLSGKSAPAVVNVGELKLPEQHELLKNVILKTTNNGHDGLRLLKRENFDLVFINLAIPMIYAGSNNNSYNSSGSSPPNKHRNISPSRKNPSQSQINTPTVNDSSGASGGNSSVKKVSSTNYLNMLGNNNPSLPVSVAAITNSLSRVLICIEPAPATATGNISSTPSKEKSPSRDYTMNATLSTHRLSDASVLTTVMTLLQAPGGASQGPGQTQPHVQDLPVHTERSTTPLSEVYRRKSISIDQFGGIQVLK